NPSFRELIRREREVALGAYGRQEAPFEKLVEEINPHRDLSRSPLFQALMILQNTDWEELEINGLKVSEISEEAVAARFDLAFVMMEGGEGIAGVLDYSQDLYEGERIRRMARHYEKVVEQVIRDAEQRIWEIELLSEAEKRQMGGEGNQTERPYPQNRCIHELFAEQAGRTPDRIAVACEGKEVSYGELNRKANQLGRYLQRLGVGPEEVVGLCLERSVEMVEALLGVLKAGGAYLPLDPEYPHERLGLMVEDAGVGVVLTEGKLEDRLSWDGGRKALIDVERGKIDRESESEPGSRVVAENPAYVIYTSGSTGQPKGVVVPHRAIGRLVLNNHYAAFETNDRVAFTSNLAFDASTMELW